MAPAAPKISKSKRERESTGENTSDLKKVRRSARLSQGANHQQLPSPLTAQESTSSVDSYHKEGTATPPEGRPSQIRHRTPEASPSHRKQVTSPIQETQLTQPYSQFVLPSDNLSDEVHDELEEGVWGYLFPLYQTAPETLVLKKRNACPLPGANRLGKDEPHQSNGKNFEAEEEAYEDTKKEGIASGGYLIGRHAECDLILEDPVISNRHCLIFNEHRHGKSVAVIEDLSSNGTFVNEKMIGRNKRIELKDQDEITVLDQARYIFRYPKQEGTSAFKQQYTLLEKLGKGHFAEVYLCVEKSSGMRYAVKVFTKSPGVEDRSKTEGLQQEIAVLMGVSHPNLLCLKDTFDEDNAVYLVLELAAEGELFNWIVMKQKLTEAEARKVFIQLFQSIKYLHERNIVHRDIKPENILLTDKELHVKVADFGLAKIIGEESFTTTLCGTPSYVAPEILEDTKHRRYTRAVDVWSLGVVLYICLCGFPPFSDELYSRDNPYTLTQQIKMGRFDYPSPYWDSVGDPALDLIDRMLTVDVEKRYTIDQCLEHPWTTHKTPAPEDSTEGLVGDLQNLDFSKRKMARERTLLSAINDVKVSRLIDAGTSGKAPVKVFVKNPNAGYVINNGKKVENGAKGANGKTKVQKELDPAANRGTAEFMKMGGKGDQPLYEGESHYLDASMAAGQ